MRWLSEITCDNYTKKSKGNFITRERHKKSKKYILISMSVFVIKLAWTALSHRASLAPFQKEVLVKAWLTTGYITAHKKRDPNCHFRRVSLPSDTRRVLTVRRIRSLLRWKMATSGAPRPSKWNKGQSHFIKWDSFLLARQSNYKVHYSNELGYSGGANEGQEGEKSHHWSKHEATQTRWGRGKALGRIVERTILGSEWRHLWLY